MWTIERRLNMLLISKGLIVIVIAAVVIGAVLIGTKIKDKYY